MPVIVKTKGAAYTAPVIIKKINIGCSAYSRAGMASDIGISALSILPAMPVIHR